MLNSKPIISIKDLRVSYDKKKPIESTLIESFSYDFEPGKIYFIIGNSDAGKTTLVKHFNGLLKSNQGTINVNDFIIDPKKKKIKNFKKLRKMISMVFQFPEYQLFKDTVAKDIMFGPINLWTKKEEAKKLAKEKLEMLGMSADTYFSRSPFALSGGQKRRVAIAGILAINPEIIIFDEPTAGLDPAGEQMMMDIIGDLKKEGKTVIVVTHVMSQVLQMADETLLLGNKKLLLSGNPYEIFTNDKIIEENYLDKPSIIKIIDRLYEVDKRFKKLYEMRPRNANDFVDCISKIISGTENG
ncbi:MAG: ATP-binding cassette domain-containing protein [Mycoplasmataceae bacterium]|nr:ATP-binding cassette domain-containing protein [Mycoplasmataceae bacterium]